MADKINALQGVNQTNDTDAKNAEWVSKLRYSRSFTAKLITSDPKVKEYYATIATALLAYEKVRSRIRWSGICFIHGKTAIARIVFAGRTLCVYLAADPTAFQDGRFKVTDVSKIKKFASCPAKIKITSAGTLKLALRVIQQIATDGEFAQRSPALPPVRAKDFPTDKFENLVARGLIRVIKTEIKQTTRTQTVEVDNDKSDETTTVYVQMPDDGDIEDDAPIAWALSEKSYRDTLLTNDALIGRHKEYPIILDFLRSKTAEIKLIKRYVVKTIDEKWVRAIEDCMDALDDCVRKPTHFIEETEEILPIERTKKVTPRSIKHLCQHTGLIAKATDDEVIPTHLLNVFREDSMMTYENKFLNTLLRRLYNFINERYNEALKNGANERVSVLSVTDKFNDGPIRGKFSFNLEISEPHGDNVRNSVKTKDLWRRVVKLKGIAADYFKSELATSLGNTFIRPPVVRTNAILKNPNMRQCLTLWEFMESYEDEGGITMDEKEELLTPEHVNMIYQGIAEQYLVLRYSTAEQAAFVGGRQFGSDITESDEERTIFGLKTSGIAEPESDDAIILAIEIAVAADTYLDTLTKKERAERQKERKDLLKAAEEGTQTSDFFIDAAASQLPIEPEKEEEEAEENAEAEESIAVTPTEGKKLHPGAEFEVRYKKSFEAKLRLADEETKEYYCEIYNAFMSRKDVWARKGRDTVTFNAGRNTLARATVIGKTLMMSFALDPSTLPARYRVKDYSDVKKYTLTPAVLKVKSKRALNNALLLVDLLCHDFGERNEDFEKAAASLFGTETIEKLIEMGLVQKKETTVFIEKPVEEAPPDLSGAGGDALVPKEEANTTEKILLPSEFEARKEAEKAKKEAAKPPVIEVRTEQAGGDALSVKPITLEELESYQPASAVDPLKQGGQNKDSSAEQKKENFWSRLFKRKK